jgi:hypothetical protein
MKCTAIFALLFSLSSFSQEAAFNYEKVKVKKGIELIDESTFAIESIAVSNDGSKLCWLGKGKDKDYLYPGTVFQKQLKNDKWQTTTKLKKKGRMLNIFSKCSFDTKGNLMTSELAWRPGAIIKTVINKSKTGVFTPKGYVSKITAYKNGKRILNLKARTLGHKKNTEFIKHPRLSPNGKWLTYYIMGMHEQKGAFLLNMNTKEVHRLSSLYDKHPTWSDDGSKILFHYTPDHKDTEAEKGLLGYFDMTFKNGEFKSAERIMLDDPSVEGYVYHKHPALYAKTDLLFFHAQSKVDGNKKLMVRRLYPNSQIHQVKVSFEGEKLHKVKHPATAMNQRGLYFIGKFKGQEYKVYSLSDKAVQKLNQKIN